MGQATGTSTTCPSWTHRLGQTVLVPLGQAQFVPTGTGKGLKTSLLVPWDKSYTHAGGLSLSRDKLYTHDGACTSSTFPNLSHKVGLQRHEAFCQGVLLIFFESSWIWLVGSWRKVRLFLTKKFCTMDPCSVTNFSQFWREIYFWLEIGCERRICGWIVPFWYTERRSDIFRRSQDESQSDVKIIVWSHMSYVLEDSQ